MWFGAESLELPPTVFTLLRDLLRERTGHAFDADRRELLADKLATRVAECGLASFLDYYYLLRYGPGAEAEWGHVLDALAVPETYFWREMDQVRALVDVLLPRHPAGGPITIWSAACASGEEPLTLAMALAEAGWFARADVRIVATDGSAAQLARAREGLYRERAFRTLPPALREKYFAPEADGWRVRPDLRDRITWDRVNLAEPAEVARLAMARYVFCRNVFLYFAPAAIARTVQVFAERMPQPGYLFVGVAESLLRVTTAFALEEIGGAFVYVKR